MQNNTHRHVIVEKQMKALLLFGNHRSHSFKRMFFYFYFKIKENWGKNQRIMRKKSILKNRLIFGRLEKKGGEELNVYRITDPPPPLRPSDIGPIEFSAYLHSLTDEDFLACILWCHTDFDLTKMNGLCFKRPASQTYTGCVRLELDEWNNFYILDN